MTELSQYHVSLGARLAPDQIPLHYGDQAAEYAAASEGAILLDRSHEGRILLEGPNRFELVNRMSTNDVSQLALGVSKPTVFVNANARILFRASCLSLSRGLLLISEAGQGEALANYLRRNIFFGDKAAVNDISASTAQFALHSGTANKAMEKLAPDAHQLPPLGCVEIDSDDGILIVARRKSICGGHWNLIVKRDAGAAVHRRLLSIGSEHGLIPAGSLTYNSLRIRSGRPAGLELSSDYIPLEVGLWDEISFSKGCYTGQEIIARMESRGRLAKTLVKLALRSMVIAPAPVYARNIPVGRLTSSAAAPDGQIHALAVVKIDRAHAGTDLSVGPDRVSASVLDFAGAQPPFIRAKASAIGGR